MKDIPSREEEGRREVFREEMMKRAEETRSFKMTKQVITKNGIGGRDLRRMSPFSSGHQSVIDIKIEREEDSENERGHEFEVGKENYFKINIENSGNDQNNGQHLPNIRHENGFNGKMENGLNVKGVSGGEVKRDNGVSAGNGYNLNTRRAYSDDFKPENGFNGNRLNSPPVRDKNGFKVNNGVKINIENLFENDKKDTNFDKEQCVGAERKTETKVRAPNDFESKMENKANNDQQPQRDIQMEDRKTENAFAFNSNETGPSERPSTGTTSGLEFSKYDQMVNTSGVEECKCAFRESEKAQLRELNDRHLLLLSEKQGVINCLMQKVENMTELREVFVDEDRNKLKETIEFLENRIKDTENQNEEAKGNEIIKDCKIEDLEGKIKDLETELQKNEEKLKEMEDLKRENAILASAKNADDEKMKWMADERDHDRENFDSFIKKVFTEKWEEITEKVEKGCDGKSYLENVKNKLEELRNAFDDRSLFEAVEAKHGEQIAALQDNLEMERANAANNAGENSEMKCKMDLLEDQLEALKKENVEAKKNLDDEKIANARKIAEKETEALQLKNLIPGLSATGTAAPGCINNIPVDLAQEIGVYRKILDAVGEEAGKEKLEEVYKSSVHSKETTTTYQPGGQGDEGHQEE
eukprot:GFUD01055034.1.p1 GENE.GFUD01055034.1~~GFUD01055034.1.p1  ORF type:complete len:644 (+),score=253.80 GFUD01055034.1:52-1983(+)